MDKLAEDEVNFKSKLIEWCQKNRLQCDFILVDDSLSGSNKHNFQSQLTIQGISICSAEGASKKESQQNASRIAYDMISNNPHFLKEITDKAQQQQDSSLEKENDSPELSAN